MRPRTLLTGRGTGAGTHAIGEARRRTVHSDAYPVRPGHGRLVTTPAPAPKRPDISMSRGEIEAFVATQSRAIVVALDGVAPVGTVADLEFAAGALVVTLHEGDDVADLLAADNRVCVIAEQFPEYYEIKGVSAHGRAALVETDDRRTRFTLGLDDTTSFDFGKIPRQGAGSGKAPT